MTQTLDFWTRARSIIDDHPRWGVPRIARSVVDDLSDQQLRRLALDHVQYIAEAVKRKRQMEAEKRATKPRRLVVTPEMKANAKADEARRREEVYAMSPESRFLHAVYATNEGSDDPRTRLLIPCNGLSYAKRKKLEQELQHERKMAMGDKVLRYLSTDDYAAWSDWVSTDEGRDACRSRLGRAIHDAEAAYRDQIRLELTAELLSSEFALGDGRRPTWGTASIEDHRARIAMQQGKAEAVIKDAARHGKAIEMLEGSGASCLNELAEQSEAA